MIPYYTGAVETGEPQRDPANSTGAFRSGTRFQSMEWDTQDPMVGVALLDAAGGNGYGVGTLTAASADSLTWTPPGGAAGAAVTVEQYDEAVLRGAEPGHWVRVVRRGSSPMQGTKAITLVDRFENLFADVVTADAVAGLTTTRALMLLNSLGAVTAFEAWIGAGDIEIALEEPTAGELLGTGLSWSSATIAGAGPSLASVADGAEVGLHIRRTIATDAAPSPSEAWEVQFSFTVGAVDYAGAIRGRYRIERTDYVKQGIWIGLAGAEPDFDAAPDETWTTQPHTTSLGLTLPAEVRAAVRQMNKWGIWGVPSETVRYDLDALGDSTRLHPSGPTEVSVKQTSANKPTVAALYDAAADEDDRAEIWVIWLETDGAEPDGTGDPTGYALVQHTAALDDLAWTSTGAALDDGTPVNALVRLRRLDASGTAHSPDVIQLAATGAGTLKFNTEITGWPASGYLKITAPVSGKLLEVVHYSGLVVATGQTTVTVDQRGLMGTTSGATTRNYSVVPVDVVDSENTAIATWEILAVAPGRPGGALLYGTQGAQAQAPLTAPNEATAIVLHAGENVKLYLGEGRASLYVDTTLVWRVLINGDFGEDNGFYIPSEWTLINGDISGAAVDEGVIDAVDANTIYVCVRGQRQMLIDLAAMEITAGSMAAPAVLLERAEQEGELARFGSTMFLVWDPAREDYRPYFDVDSSGVVSTALPYNQLLTAAEVEALWQP